jgi:Tol biopolymer transport system component
VRIETAGGQRVVLTAPRRRYSSDLRLSAAGTRLLLSILDPAGGMEVWTYDLGGGALVPLGRGEGWDEEPFWGPGGTTVGWTSESCMCVASRVADGTAPSRSVFETGSGSLWGRDSRDDGLVVGEYSDDTDRNGIWTFRFDDPESMEPYLTGGAYVGARNPAFSPDGRFIAYSSDQSGRYEIYVRAFPRLQGEADREWRVSSDGGGEPHWLADGRVVYRQGRSAVARQVETGPSFRVSEPVILAEGLEENAWTISQDGDFFIVLEETEQPRLVLITNWFAELERLVPH